MGEQEQVVKGLSSEIMAFIKSSASLIGSNSENILSKGTSVRINAEGCAAIRAELMKHAECKEFSEVEVQLAIGLISGSLVKKGWAGVGVLY